MCENVSGRWNKILSKTIVRAVDKINLFLPDHVKHVFSFRYEIIGQFIHPSSVNLFDATLSNF